MRRINNLEDLKRHEEEASLTQEEWNERILDKINCQQEWLDKHPEIQQSLLAIRARLQTRNAQGLVKSWDIR